MADEIPIRIPNPDGTYFEIEFEPLHEKRLVLVMHYDSQGGEIGGFTEPLASFYELLMSHKEVRELDEMDRLVP